MRRVSTRIVAPAVAIASTAQRREIYSIWGTVCQEDGVVGSTGLLQRIFADVNQRSFAMNTIPAVTKERGTTEPEQYLISAINDDFKRLQSVDWTVDFDPFWRDRVQSHQKLFDILYVPGGGLGRMLIGSAKENVQAKVTAEAALNRLKSALKWAEECEKAYSAIVNARFLMQREVFDAFEREKILAGCVEAVDKFTAAVPSEFRRKAVADLDWHLGIMRHWVWDCPNAKQHYPRQLA